jgi:hypothetical protein
VADPRLPEHVEGRPDRGGGVLFARVGGEAEPARARRGERAPEGRGGVAAPAAAEVEADDARAAPLRSRAATQPRGEPRRRVRAELAHRGDDQICAQARLRRAASSPRSTAPITSASESPRWRELGEHRARAR